MAPSIAGWSRRGGSVTGITTLGLFLLLSRLALATPTLPAGFVAEEVAPGASWSSVVGIAFAPDGRIFVAEKQGRVHVIEGGMRRPLPFLDISNEVLNSGDRGLLGLALDPNFAVSPLVYLLYTVDPNDDGVDDDGATYGRLTRYRASAADANRADLASRTVLLGDGWTTGIPAIDTSHGPGCLRFGSDGTLLVSAGDAAHFSFADGGGNDPLAFGEGKLPLTEDIGAFRSQWIGSLAGKVLRLDPRTGLGLPSNPFFTGDASAPESRVWAYGLRQPYRFCRKPGTGSLDPAAGSPGTLFVAEVGWVTWEEVNVLDRPGLNFGWPCREGLVAAAEYPALSPAHHGCSTLGTSGNPSLPTSPLVTWHHSDATRSSPPGIKGKAAAAIAFYEGTRYPTRYQGACFVGDFVGSWIKVLRLDGAGNLLAFEDFATSCDGPVDLVADPLSGDLHYVAINTGILWRIRSVNNATPTARISPSTTFGTAPVAVTFDGTLSSSPGNAIVEYRWTFGDGAMALGPTATHVFTTPGTPTVTLTVVDAAGLEGSARVTLSIQSGATNTPPTAIITSPSTGALYRSDATLRATATAVDAEDPGSSLALSWEVRLHHNSHVHPSWKVATGSTLELVPGTHDDGTGVWLELICTATDSQGARGTATVNVYPREELIALDDGAAGTSSKGTWSVSQGTGSYGSRSLYSKTSGNWYRFDLPIENAGDYAVYAWYSSFPSRHPAVPHTVTHGAGSTQVLVDQRTGGGDWKFLGVYSVDHLVRLTVLSAGGGYSTCADAFGVVPLRIEEPPTELILDDGAPGTSFTGTWLVSGGTNPLGSQSLYAKTRATYTYRIELPAPGDYEISAWWTAFASRSDSVPYSIVHSGGTAVVRRSQLVNGGKWNSLGVFHFDSAATVTVTAQNDGKSYCADAIRITTPMTP